MTRVNVFKLEKRMVLAMVNYSKATKEGAMLNYHTPGGLRTVGSDGLRHELLDADIVDRLRGGLTVGHGEPFFWRPNLSRGYG